MNNEARELIKKSKVKALNIREKREVEEARRKKEEEDTKRQLEEIIKEAEKNGTILIKTLLFSILDEYEKRPEAIGNSDKEEKISTSIKFLEHFDIFYKSTDKRQRLSEVYNGGLDESEKEKKIFYFAVGDGVEHTYKPVKINLQDFEDLGIFESVEIIYRELITIVDMYRLKLLTIKAKNGELNDKLFDEETIQRLKESYNIVKAKENKLNHFLESIKENSDKAYLDMLQKMISAYGSCANNKKIEVNISMPYSDSSSPCEKMVRLYKDSKIDPNDAVVYYPIKTNNNLKVKPDLYPILISELIQKIQEDFPSTEFELGTYYGAESGRRLTVKVNTLEFESLLISIQNPDKKTKKEYVKDFQN